jgi:hypothetical protein
MVELGRGLYTRYLTLDNTELKASRSELGAAREDLLPGLEGPGSALAIATRHDWQ